MPFQFCCQIGSMKRLSLLFITFFSFAGVFAQLATYSPCGGTCTTVTGIANETVTNLLASGFGANTPCSSGGLSGMTVATSWATYSTAGPRVYIKITPNAGFMLNVTSFTAGLRRSGTGPACVRFAYSLDNGSTWTDDAGCHSPSSGGCGSTSVSSWLGGPLPTNISSTTNGIIVALFPYQPGAAAGTFQVNSLVIGGNVVPSCSLPNVYSVTGGGSFCSGGSGVAVGLGNSQSGVSYQLYRGAMAVGSPVPGTGSAISFGLQTVAGTYTVLATGTPSSCTSNMSGSATVVVNTTPSTITGATSICQGLSSALASSPSGGTWSSSAATIASVSSGGSVTGVVAGTATITYTLTGPCIATTTVTVNPSAPAITGTATVCQGLTTTMANAVAGGAWSATSPAASVSSSGIVTGTAAGIATISYTMPTCNPQTIDVTVNAQAAITGPSVVCELSSVTLANVNAGGTWSSNNTSIATITPGSGIMTGVLAGTTTITYVLPTGCTSLYNVTVTPLPPAIGGSAYICQGATTTLTNSVTGGFWTSSNMTGIPIDIATGVMNGLSAGTATITYTLPTSCATTTAVTVSSLPAPIGGVAFICQGGVSVLSNSSSGGAWSSSNPAVASIAASGLVTGVASGTAVITYTLGSGCTAFVTVTVNPSLASITGASSVCQGLTTALNHVTAGGTWSSANTAVATIDPATGVVTGVFPGTALISYSVGTGCVSTFVMTVITPPAFISGPISVCVGNSITLSNAVAGGGWSGSSFAASINILGVVTGANMGAATFSYTIPGCTTITHTVVVNPLPPSITGLTNVCEGASTTLSNTDPGGTWSSSSSFASVSSAGVVTGVSVGMPVNVTYTLSSGCYTYVPIIVDSLPDPIVGVDTLCPGTTVTFTDITGGGLWSSSNGMKATAIAATGEIIAVNTGAVTISYTLLSGCYQTYPLFVLDPLPASVTFNVSPDTTVLCSEVPVTFSASSVNGGVPSYEWQIFGVTVDTGATFTYNPTHGDFVTCRMTANGVCAAPSPATHSMYMNVYPVVPPLITISTTSVPHLTFLGQVFTFNSLVTYGGSSQTYQWYCNGVAIPGATNIYYATPVYHTDTFYCIVKGQAPCSTGDSGISNTIVIKSTLDAGSLSSADDNFSLYPNPNNGNFVLERTLEQLSGDLAIKVTNMLGQVVYRKSLLSPGSRFKETFSIESLDDGLYVLRISGADVNKTLHFRIAK